MESIIFNFHGIGPVTREVDAGELDCWLEQSFFESVLDLLRNQPRVRITFDDGNASDLTHAAPALIARNLKATFFVCSNRLREATFLNENDVRELQAKGMTIGSHGADHVPWRNLCEEKLLGQVKASKDTLESVCQVPVEQAACPFGEYDRAVLKGLRSSGYKHVYTSDGGLSREDNWLQARTTIRRSMRIEDIDRSVKQGPGALNQTLISLRQWAKKLR